MKFEELFATLNNLNVNDKKEKRTNGKTELSYLSWTWAVSEFTKADPDFDYEIKMFPNENNVLLPYMYDENTGYMVMTSVTSCGKTKTMWLPVMDGANNAMKSNPYQYKNKWGDVKNVEAATMFDINKTIMRCLTKNLAMFGLGLYIYAGEDLPEEADPQNEPTAKPQANTKPQVTTDTAKKENLVIGSPDASEDSWKMYWYELKKLCPDEEQLKRICKENGVDTAKKLNGFYFNAIRNILEA